MLSYFSKLLIEICKDFENVSIFLTMIYHDIPSFLTFDVKNYTQNYTQITPKPRCDKFSSFLQIFHKPLEICILFEFLFFSKIIFILKTLWPQMHSTAVTCKSEPRVARKCIPENSSTRGALAR